MDNAGCTFKEGKGGISAYKLFENDPLLFSQSLQLSWRCGEMSNGQTGCPSDYPPPHFDKEEHVNFAPQLADTVVTTYTWVYEW